MASDLDILRTAHGLIRLHGPDAELIAARRADELLGAGDMDGHALSLRILKAIKELRRSAPDPGETTH